MQNAVLQPRKQSPGDSPFAASGGETWNRLQNLKEEVSGDLLGEGPLCRSEVLGLRQGEESKANAWDIEWLHRAQLEARLREIVDAQDRLLDGTYGKCLECGEQITPGRLMADPAAHLCLNCQRTIESDHQFSTL
ncbi:MAG TPA: TraR/DksA family transcriptional regulator [Pyrinomonadaceae bacterium]|nr:TraR/DksA family transcriptional regulator [Pyrinomonadaceae bacterium]